ncbi:hypothetical protein [Niveispirillum fermenti]|uniref:hypothetical protein n=1 Tax=Niveispirillum fermenti TaxID=1233113 RepID=UPI0040410A24
MALISLFATAMLTFALLLAVPGLGLVSAGFEILSAYATVGLTGGATAMAGAAGHLVLILAMYLGRLGPLALGFALLTEKKVRVEHPRAEILMG